MHCIFLASVSYIHFAIIGNAVLDFVAGLEAVLVAFFLGAVMMLTHHQGFAVCSLLYIILLLLLWWDVLLFFMILYFLRLCYWNCSRFRFNCFLLSFFVLIPITFLKACLPHFSLVIYVSPSFVLFLNCFSIAELIWFVVVVLVASLRVVVPAEVVVLLLQLVVIHLLARLLQSHY